MIAHNPGKLIGKILNTQPTPKIGIKKIRDKLEYTANNTVKERITDFKNNKGKLKTFIRYCKVFDKKVEFIIYNQEEKYIGDNLAELLESIRRNKNLLKKEIANKLNLSGYTYTYNTLKRNGCTFKKAHKTFSKLGYKIKYKVIPKEDK